jgi:surfactin synthase thioesterase subunit
MADHSKWFLRDLARSQAGLRLFCFPYAGGAASIYRQWANRLPPGVEVIAVELPGRGKHLAEPPFRRMPMLIDRLATIIPPLLDVKFAFFGHSMGATIAFELARELRRRQQRQPAQLFVSGRQAPPVADPDPPTYNLPEDEFRAELLRLNGTPAEVLEHAELMNLMMPLLRADFELIQTYEYVEEQPLRCPITAYGGLQDEGLGREMLLPWKEQTEGKFSLHMLPGDHFFLRSASRILLELLERELSMLSSA